MSVIQNPDSDEARELAKWNQPYRYQEYPVRMYLASRPVLGGPPEFKSVQADDREEANLRSRGWGRGQFKAVELLEARELALATAAAERTHAERFMGDKAKAEARQADAATDAHVGEVPVTPIRRRAGRPKKIS